MSTGVNNSLTLLARHGKARKSRNGRHDQSWTRWGALRLFACAGGIDLKLEDYVSCTRLYPYLEKVNTAVAEQHVCLGRHALNTLPAVKEQNRIVKVDKGFARV
jgi:hypothetical protein